MTNAVPPAWPHDVLTLAVDIGGTGLKAAQVDCAGVMASDKLKVATPYPCPPERLVSEIVALTAPLHGHHRVSIGFPGLVRRGVVLEVPAFSRREYGGKPDPDLASLWTRFHLADAFAHAFNLPVLVVNDADMQGAAVVQGDGVEFVMTLGTGVGTALFSDGQLLPHFELSHGPFRKGMTTDIALGEARRQEIGTKHWLPDVRQAIENFDDMLCFDRIYVGGGNAKRLDVGDVGPKGVIVPNTAGILGGVRIWQMAGGL
ncbi:MAG: ROK family protein [Actinomycetota bacterium]